MTANNRRTFNPWPVGVIAAFVIFVSATIALVVFSSFQRMDLVTADYYEQEIRYQGQIDRMQRTSGLRAQMKVSYDAKAACIRLTLPADQARGALKGAVTLYRPSEAGRDRNLALELDAAGTQVVDAAGLLPGLWKVRIHWSAGGEDFFVDEPVIIPPRAS